MRNADIKNIVQCVATSSCLLSTNCLLGLWTPLHQAAAKGDVAGVRAALIGGIDVNARSEIGGETALHCAVQWDNIEVVKLLLGAGADVNARDRADRWNRTPLHWAAMYGRVDNANLLLGAGADVNAKDNSGYTALSLAVTEFRKRNKETVRLLLGRRGINVNAADIYGYTVLHDVVRWGKTEIVEMLLTAPGINVNVTVIGGRDKGKTALDLVEECENRDRARREQIKALLLARGAKTGAEVLQERSWRSWFRKLPGFKS